jgi:hypothetical protein
MGAKGEIGVRTILSSRICRDEIMECDEHEIVAKISTFLGEEPCEFCKAEKIFNEMKYEIARYIIAHEYCCDAASKKSEDLLLWLDEKTSPLGVRQLVETIEKYLK